jgi:O-succinylbenzoic acid--CoA ligase
MERAELKAVVRATGCAVERGEIAFLHDPNWSPSMRAEAELKMKESAPTLRTNSGLGWLCVPTGGSGGAVKFVRHDEETLSAAVHGFCAHFGLERVNAVDVLPAHHVSGLMARVRCAATGGRHLAWDWKQMEAGAVPSIDGENNWVLSLVPTQLQRLLENPATVAWLRRLKIIFLGGGPVWPELADAAATARLRVSFSYGLTETAAMIAALPPEEFLSGTRSCGVVMPHARVVIDASTGVIRIAGDSVFRGYWPEWRETREFVTEDLGATDERGHLHVLGRRDAVIITGGKKVDAAAVELALRESGEFSDVAVIGVADRDWGEMVVACYPHDDVRKPDLRRAVERLAKFQRPKRFVALAEWPRYAQVIINREALRAAVREVKAEAGGTADGR